MVLRDGPNLSCAPGFNASSPGAEITVSHIHRILFLKHSNNTAVY